LSCRNKKGKQLKKKMSNTPLETTLRQTYLWFQKRCSELDKSNQNAYKNALKAEFMDWEDETIKEHDIISLYLLHEEAE